MSIVRMVTRDAAKKANPATMHAQDGQPMGQPLPVDQPAAGNDKALTQALEILSEYIPTEVVAIYVFGLSLLKTVETEFGDLPIWHGLFGLCLLLCVVFTVFAWRALQQKDPDMTFPLWPLIAAIISFSVWSMAIPGNPITGTPATAALAGFAALVSSFLLRGVENAFVPDKPA